MEKNPDIGSIRADELKKPGEVAAMFDVVAPNYDLAMTLSLWDRCTCGVALSGPQLIHVRGGRSST